jgi:teichoic acid transport system ATP-binding protein
MMLGMSRRHLREAYQEVVAFSGLARFMDEPVKHYSTGMRSRLGFSTAVTLDPDILIVDEALSAGDAAFREKAALKIRDLMARARAVIVVTHDLPFVEAVCTRALWLEAGRISFAGAPADAVRHYRRAAWKPQS